MCSNNNRCMCSGSNNYNSVSANNYSSYNNGLGGGYNSTNYNYYLIFIFLVIPFFLNHFVYAFFCFFGTLITAFL